MSAHISMWEIHRTLYGEYWVDMQPEVALSRPGAETRAAELRAEMAEMFDRSCPGAWEVWIEQVHLEPTGELTT